MCWLHGSDSCETHLESSLLSERRSLCQAILASGIPFTWQLSLTTPPSSTARDCGWDRNFGRAGGMGDRSVTCSVRICCVLHVCDVLQLTGELYSCLSADQHAVAVLSSTVVLSSVRLVALTSLGEVLDQQRTIAEHIHTNAGHHSNTITSPCDGNRPLPFHLAMQHQGAVPDSNDITGLCEEGEL